MAVDIQKLFNDDLPGAIAKHQDAAKELDAKFQINITGEGGGEWFIDLSKATGARAEKGNPGGADCSITISSEDFHKLHENPQANGMQLFFGGKLKITGNPMLAQKLGKLFDLQKAS
jgi:putative sterol carrier protein